MLGNQALLNEQQVDTKAIEAEITAQASQGATPVLLAVGVTTLLYISLALVLLSDVSALELEKYADTAVAQAASPLLGHVVLLASLVHAVNVNNEIQEGLFQSGRIMVESLQHILSVQTEIN